MNNYNIQTVSRALDVLEQFVENNTELGITDLSTRLNLQKNNVFRLVATLKARNYIEVNDSTGKYRLGLKTSVLGMAANRHNNLASHARPVLHRLKMLSLENCYLAVRKDSHSYYIDGVESDLPVRAAHRIGSSLPLHCTAAGKMLLAFLGREEMMCQIQNAELQRFTPRTIADPDGLLVELRTIAHQGYAVEDQEHDSGVMELAAPVFDSNGTILGALCISGPTMRLAGDRVKNEMITLLQREAAQLSDSLGRRREPLDCFAAAVQSPKKLRTGKKVICKSSVSLH
jgi:DNA-binding IclR family transcriptional regulator